MKYFQDVLERKLRQKLQDSLNEQHARISESEFERLYEHEVDKFAEKLFDMVETGG